MRPDEIRALAEQAHNEVTALCAGPHRPGGKRWRMTVPVRRDDSDILFSNLAAEAERLAGYVEQVLALDPHAHDTCDCDLSGGWRQTIQLVQSLLQGPQRPAGSVAVEQRSDSGLRGVPIPAGECEVAAGYRAPGTCCSPPSLPECAFMGCEHLLSDHGPEGCTVERLDYYERRFTAEGERLPPRMRPCGCPKWREQTVAPSRLPRKVVEEAPPRHSPTPTARGDEVAP